MTQEKPTPTPKNQTLTLTDRKALIVEGVRDVVRFEEESILLDTDLGLLEVDGSNLRIAKLDPDRQMICLNGEICAMLYLDATPKKKGLWRR